MDIKERLKKIRNNLHLTQQEFADKLGIKRNTVATYETGKSNPSDSAVVLICREFNVNEEWLRTGRGEMFNPKPSDTLEGLAHENGFSKADYAIVEKIISLRPQERKELFGKVFDFLHEIDDMLSGTDPFSPAFPVSAPAATDAPMEKTVEELEAEYKKAVLRSAQNMDSSASGTTSGNAKERSETG